MEWLLAAVLGGFLAFNAAVTPDRAAKLAESSLQKKFPDSIVHVEMEGKKGKAVLNGKFRKVRLEIKNLVVDDLPFEQSQAKLVGEAKTFEIALENVTWDAMPVEKIDLSFQDLRYDLKALKDDSKLSFVSFGPSQLKLRIGSQAMKPLFAAKMTDVRDLAVTMRDGVVTATGQREVFGFPAPFEFRATPGFEGNRLLFENQKLFVSGVPVPEALARPIIGNINPVYTFDKSGKWPFFPNITKVVAVDEGLEIEAALTQKTAPAIEIATPSRTN